DEIAEVADDNAIRFHACVLEDVELFEGRFAGNSRVREYRNVRRDVRLSDGAEYLALIRGDLIPGGDFAKGAENIVVGLFNERLDDLFFAHRRNLFRLKRLRV